MHTLPLQLRFNDVDMMGHVNNAVIMEFFDLGKSHYFADAGLPVIIHLILLGPGMFIVTRGGYGWVALEMFKAIFAGE